MKYNEIDVMYRIEKKVFELKHMRKEGFRDDTLDSTCVINEIKFLFKMLNESNQNEILKKDWLDDR